MTRPVHLRARLHRLRAHLVDLPRRLRGTPRPDDREIEAGLVWIMGSPRTGSTWLLNLIGWITHAAVVDEPLIGTHLATPVSVITGHAAGHGTDELVTDAFAPRPDYFFSDAHTDAWVPGLRDLLLRRLAHDLPAERDRSMILVKEPNGSLGAPVLMRCLPASRLLFLVRDGRDVVDSFLDGIDGGWIGENFGLDVQGYGGRQGLLTRRAEQWVREMDAVQRAYDDHDPSLRMILRYEDLLHAPVERLGQVLAWLGRPADTEQIEEATHRLSSERIPADQRGPGKFVRAATAGLWREHFDESEQALLAEIMAPTLTRLGYR